MEFVFEFVLAGIVALAAFAGAFGITSLDHEARDEPVELRSGVIATLAEFEEVFSSLGGVISVNLNLQRAQRCQKLHQSFSLLTPNNIPVLPTHIISWQFFERFISNHGHPCRGEAGTLFPIGVADAFVSALEASQIEE